MHTATADAVREYVNLAHYSVLRIVALAQISGVDISKIISRVLASL